MVSCLFTDHRRPQRRVPRRRRARPRPRLGAAALHPRDRRARRDAAGDPRDGPLLRAAPTSARARLPRRDAGAALRPTRGAMRLRGRQWADDRHLRREARPHPGLPGRRAERAGAGGDRRRRHRAARLERVAVPAAPGGGRGDRERRRRRSIATRTRTRPCCAAGSPSASRCEPGSIAVGNGSCEILLAAAAALCEPGAEILYAWPSFSIYPYLAPLPGAREIRVPLAEGDVHDLDAMLAEVTAATQLLIVCNPNNPTATHIPAAGIGAFFERVPAHVTVILDEAYVEFQTNDDPDATTRPASRLPQPRRPAHLQQVLRARRPAGRLRARLREFRAAVDAVRQPFSVNAVAQAAGAEAIRHQDDVARRVESTIVERVPVEEGVASSASRTPSARPTSPGSTSATRTRRRSSRPRRAPGDRGSPRHAAGRPRAPPRHLRHHRRERALPRRARRAAGLNPSTIRARRGTTSAVSRTGDTTSSLRATGAALDSARYAYYWRFS